MAYNLAGGWRNLWRDENTFKVRHDEDERRRETEGGRKKGRKRQRRGLDLMRKRWFTGEKTG